MYEAEIRMVNGAMDYERIWCPYENENVYQTPTLIYDFSISIKDEMC